jgi:hypothetical protein
MECAGIRIGMNRDGLDAHAPARPDDLDAIFTVIMRGHATAYLTFWISIAMLDPILSIGGVTGV